MSLDGQAAEQALAAVFRDVEVSTGIQISGRFWNKRLGTSLFHTTVVIWTVILLKSATGPMSNSQVL